jgi:hypothetical protein
MKRKHNRFVVFIVAVFAIGYIGNLVIDNPYTHGFINWYLNEKILKNLPVRVEYQSMKVQLFPPAISVYGLHTSTDSVAGVNKEIFSIATATFKVSAWSIFMANPQIGDLDLKDPKVTWPLPEDFLTALQKLEPKPKQNKTDTTPQWPPSQPPPIHSLKISNAMIIADFDGVSLNIDQSAKEITHLSSESFDLELDIRDWKSFSIELRSKLTFLSDTSSSYLEGGSINLRGEMRDDTFLLRKLNVNSPRLSLEGNSEIKIETNKKSKHIEKINIGMVANSIDSDLSLVGSFLDIPGNRGRIEGSAVLDLSIPISSKGATKFVTQGHIKSHDSRFYDFRLYDTETDFKIDLDSFSMSNTKIKLGDVVVAKGSGQIAFDKAITYKFNLTPDNLPLADLLGIFNVNFDTVNFNLSSPSLVISGTGDPFILSATSQASLTEFSTPSVTYDHSRHKEQPQCDMELDLTVNSKELRMQKGDGWCRINGIDSIPGKFPLKISGYTTFNSKSGMDLLLTSDQFNPAPLAYFSQMAMFGSGQLSTRIHGPYDDVRVNIQTEIKDTILGSTSIGDLKANAEINGDSVTWHDLKIETPSGGNLNSREGKILFDEDQTIDFKFNAYSIDHSIIGNGIHDITRSNQGTEFVAKSIEGNLKGPILRPLNWIGSLSVDLQSIRDHENTYAKSAKGQINFTENGIKTDNLRVSIGGISADVNIEHTFSQKILDENFIAGLGLHPNDHIEIGAKFNGIPGAGDEVKTLPVVGNLAGNYGVSAEISGDAKISGTFKKMSGIMRFQSSKTKILNASVSNFVGNLIIDGQKLDIMADQGGSALKARINFDFSKDEIPFNWYITAKNADFRPWLPDIMSQDARNFAYLSATWNLKGTLKNWWASQGDLDLKDIRLRFYSKQSRTGQRIDLKTAHSSHIVFSGNQWVLSKNEPITVVGSFGELKVGLSNHRPPAQIGLTVDARADLDILKMFVADLESATGTVAAIGTISGSIDKPIVNIAVHNANDANGPIPLTVSHMSYRPSLQDMFLNAQVTWDGINIKRLTANKGSGNLELSGIIARPGSGIETELSLALNSASFLYPFPIVKYFESSIDGQIKISGARAPFVAAGRIKIIKARSNRDVDIRDAILESLRSQSAVDSTESIAPFINFDLSVEADRSIVFNSRSGQATLSSDLKIGGSDVAPSVLGLVEIPKGRFFYKRDFDIKRGLINFDDPIKVDPALDISAVSDVGNYRVGISISGRSSNPLIDFTVDPPTRPDGTTINKIEIISLLSRGSLPENTTGKSNSESAAAAEALNLLAGQVEDTVQKIFDLSGQNVIRQVYIDTYADSEGTPVARFNLPLNITEDLDVILKVDQNTVKVSSEYSLHDSISLTGGIENSNEQTGTNGKTSGVPADTGVDLKFKFAFP